VRETHLHPNRQTVKLGQRRRPLCQYQKAFIRSFIFFWTDGIRQNPL